MEAEDKIENKNTIAEESKTSESSTSEEKMLLNSTWTFWYASRKEKVHHIPYSNRLIKLAECNNLQDFFKYYIYLKLVNEIKRNIDIVF